MLIKNKWYDVELVRPPVGELVILGIHDSRIEHRGWLPAIAVGAGFNDWNGRPVVSSTITHFMIPSDPMEA